MPRYFFRLRNGDDLGDLQGEELMDDAAARDMAIEVMAELMSTKREHLSDGGDYQVLVTDIRDREVYSITAQGRRL